MKFPLDQAMKAHRSSLCLTSALDGVSVSATPRLFTLGNDPVSFVQGVSESQNRSGQTPKISPTSYFDARTVQPVASRYTD
jgi:hypothetical protein